MKNYLHARLHLEQNQKIMKYWNLFWNITVSSNSVRLLMWWSERKRQIQNEYKGKHESRPLSMVLERSRNKPCNCKEKNINWWGKQSVQRNEKQKSNADMTWNNRNERKSIGADNAPMERFYWIILWKKQKSLDAEQYALKEILIFMEKADLSRQASLASAIMDCRKARMHLSFCAKNWYRDILMELQESMHLRQGIW